MDMNMTKVYEAGKLKFMNYNVIMPNDSSLTPMMQRILQIIGQHNFTKDDTKKSDYIFRLIEVVQKVYQEQNSIMTYYEGTFSDVAVMDTEDNYVSVVT